jgi:hypothetical protein
MSNQEEYVPTEEDMAKAKALLEKTGEKIFKPSDEVVRWLFAAVVHLVTAEALGHPADLVLKINGKAIRIDLAPEEDDVNSEDEDEDEEEEEDEE